MIWTEIYLVLLKVLSYTQTLMQLRFTDHGRTCLDHISHQVLRPLLFFALELIILIFIIIIYYIIILHNAKKNSNGIIYIFYFIYKNLISALRN